MQGTRPDCETVEMLVEDSYFYLVNENGKVGRIPFIEFIGPGVLSYKMLLREKSSGDQYVIYIKGRDDLDYQKLFCGLFNVESPELVEKFTGHKVQVRKDSIGSLILKH